MEANKQRRVVYLHGFASSPQSNKAQLFSAALASRGVQHAIPDLNEDDFKGLTLSRQLLLLHRITSGAAPRSVLLIGSSMGAYVSALFAARDVRVAALVLMAPAFDFIRRWTTAMSQDALERWRTHGSMQVHHVATQSMQPIGWSLVEDARTHAPYPRVELPTLVFHGRQDEAVPCSCSERFARDCPDVTLELLDSDHSLADRTAHIIQRSMTFLGRWLPELRQEAGHGPG